MPKSKAAIARRLARATALIVAYEGTIRASVINRKRSQSSMFTEICRTSALAVR